MEATVMIDGKPVKMKATALVPRLYRFKFGRDMVADMNQLCKAYQKVAKLPKNATKEQRQDAQLSAMDLTIFENVSFIMIKHAGEKIPDSPEDWLESINGIFSVYQIMPTILKLWDGNKKTTSIPKKK